MNDTTSKINRLEEQVNELLELCDKLGEENSNLRAQLQHITGERATLIELKEQARKVGADAIIIRSTEGGNFNWGQGGWDRAKADAVAIRYVVSSE